MTERDHAADLEFWSGRGRGGSVGQDPELPRRKPYRSSRLARLAARLPQLSRLTLRRPSLPWTSTSGARDRARGTARPAAAAALLAGLTAAWLFVGHRSHPSSVAAVGAVTTTPTVVAPATAAPTVAPTVATDIARTPKVGALRPPADSIARPYEVTSGCTGLSAARPHVLCRIDDVVVEVALYTSGTVANAFRRIAGAEMKARSGPARCAAGRADERAWSVASAPRYAVGRYMCRLEAGRAAIWWTHGDRLLHSVAGNPRDSDLAKLFAWWRAHPSE